MSDVESIIRALGLKAHPEGGFFRETFRAPLVLDGNMLPHAASRAASTAIYYLLPAWAFSAWHRVRSDEGWHFYGGSPLELHMLTDEGEHVVERLGSEVLAGERPQAIVPAGRLQAARAPGPRHALVGCTVAPGFDFADWELPSRASLSARFPSHAALIAALTRG